MNIFFIYFCTCKNFVKLKFRQIEISSNWNSFFFLVFFDDGYASYIKHEDIRVVCQQTENAVWEDVHSNSRDFVKKYLQQYPERPMVKLSLQQNVSVELEGKSCIFYFWH